MTTVRTPRLRPPLWAVVAAFGAFCQFAGGTTVAAPVAPPAPPVPSTGAPHPSAPVVKVAGMTLEIRSGRVVVAKVERGSPADRAAIRPLDVVLVANDRSLVDLDPISPQQVLALLKQDAGRRTHLVIGRGAGTLSVDLPGESGDPPEAPPLELTPGLEAPVFGGRTIEDKDFSLKDLRGSLVLIDFWASTCPPCERAVIPLRRIAEQSAGKLQIVGVSLDADRKSFEAFAYNHHLPGIQLFDGAAGHGPISRLYGVPDTGIPHYVLIDRDGLIVAIGGLDTMEETIARLAASTR